jgi:hypothetical protein
VFAEGGSDVFAKVLGTFVHLYMTMQIEAARSKNYTTNKQTWLY